MGTEAADRIRAMIADAKPATGQTIFYAFDWDRYRHALIGTGESVMIGIDVGSADFKILVTDEAGNQYVYNDFDEAMQAISWNNVAVAVARIRDQLTEIGRAFARSASALDFPWLRPIIIPDPPPAHPHHWHLFDQAPRSARKPRQRFNMAQRRERAARQLWKPQHDISRR